MVSHLPATEYEKACILTAHCSTRKTTACETIRPRPDTPNLIMTLPGELRNHIYSLALTEAEEILVGKPSGWREPGLLFSSKEIRMEALRMYYESNKFNIIVAKGELKPAMRRLVNLVQEFGKGLVIDMEIRFRKANFWDDLSDLLPLLEVMRDPGFEPARTQYDFDAKNGVKHQINSSIFRMPRINMLNGLFVAEKALSMGRRAYAEDWTAEKLERCFGEFSEKQKKVKGKKKVIKVDGQDL